MLCGNRISGWCQRQMSLHCIVPLIGVNPQSVRGSRTGVFVGCSASEPHDAWTADAELVTGYEMTGCTRSMFANRLSYFFDFRGTLCVTVSALVSDSLVRQ